MISIFDDNNERLSIAWNGIEFNQPTLTRDAQTGKRVDSIGFSTPSNFHSEAVNDIIKNGGGIEFYNPLVGTRIVNLRGSITADKESNLVDQIVQMQRAFHPLYLQSVFGLNYSGTLTWPPPDGLPDWVRAKPLTFTRVLPKTLDPTGHPDGLFELQYHVVPISLPDPVRADVLQGVGVDYEAQFLILDGGRSFSQTESTQVGDGDITWSLGYNAPVWPEIEFDMDGAGSSTLTITTTQGHMATSLVLDTSALGASDSVVIDTRDRAIWVNGSRTASIYASGDYPVLRGNGDTTIAWTNTTNVTSSTNLFRYRESSYV